ncbi:MAG: DUF2142 domain-containing protein [Clostridia bacterium]|nr:DUF2142 domain-containing protein [Clostridia bacterium]
MKKVFKHIFYAVFSVLLILSLLGLFTYSHTNQPVLLGEWNADALLTAPVYGVEKGEEDITLFRPNTDSHILLDTNGRRVNLIRVTFSESLPTEPESLLFWSNDGELIEAQSVKGIRESEYSMLFALSAYESGEVLRIVPKDGGALPLAVSAYEMPEVTELHLSIPAAVLLGVTLLLLLIIEKKFGYFAFVTAPIREAVKTAKELIDAKKRARLLLHFFAWIAAFVYVCAIIGFVMLEIYTKTAFWIAFGGAVAAIALQLANRIAAGKSHETAKLFLVVTVLAGILLCYTMPTHLGVAWDDETHFRRTYNMVHQLDDEMSVAEYQLLHVKYDVNAYSNDPMQAVLAVEQWDSVTVEDSPWMFNLYGSLGYLPMAAASGIGTLLDFDIATTMVACRVANLLTYAVVIWFAIRKLRSGAMIFAAVALLPSALFLACSLNYDFWVTAWLAFALGHFISVMQRDDRSFRTRDICAILCGLLLCCAPKAIYCVLFFPLLFLPKAKFESRKASKLFRIALVLAVLAVVASVALPMLFSPDKYTDLRGGSEVSTGGQVSYIFSHPARYTGTLLSFLGDYVSFFMMSQYACFFGYLGNAHLFFSTIAGFLLLYTTFTDRRENDGYERMQPTRLLTLATCFAQVCLIATSLYVSFTPVGLDTINGCQYRYIFPILIPCCFFLAPSKIKCEINEKFQHAFVFGGLAIGVLGSFFSVYMARFLA